jgi:hypothetical protein
MLFAIGGDIAPMMITLIDGSPKKGEGASSAILDILKGFLAGPSNSVQTLKAYSGEEGIFRPLDGNAVAISFPLYLDGMPSGLADYLERLSEDAKARGAGPRGPAFLYAVVNSGFHEAHRSHLALEAARLFAEGAGLSYGQGLALGGGPLVSMSPERAKKGSWPFGGHCKAIRKLAGSIRTLASAPDMEASPSMPRSLYNFGANMRWRMLAKKNGLSRKDLYR